MPELLTGKVLLVVGGGRGIGAAAVRVFAAEGARVIVSARTESELQAVVAAVPTAAYVVSDATAETEVAALVDGVVSRHGRLDGAFNVAGGGTGGATSLFEEEAVYDHAFDINVRSAWLATKHEARAIAASAGGGAIVNTSSIAASITGTRTGLYGPAKAAVSRLGDIAARELGPLGVRVNTIVPGAILTDALASWDDRTPGVLDELRRLTPLDRLGTPVEVANAAAWLLSDYASYVSGSVLRVDGARSS